MQYLVDRYDPDYKISFPKGTREYYEMNNWLFFQNAGVGPMQGQASKYSFRRLSLNSQLEEREWQSCTKIPGLQDSDMINRHLEDGLHIGECGPALGKPLVFCVPELRPLNYREASRKTWYHRS